MKMKASPGDSFTPPGVEPITADDNGLADIPEDLADLARSHGFADWVDPPAFVQDETGEPVLPLNADQFDAMNRAGLFAYIAAHGGGARPKNNNEELMALARVAKATIAASEKP